MTYDPEGRWAGDRIGTRRPPLTEWDDPSADEALGVEEMKDARNYRTPTNMGGKHQRADRQKEQTNMTSTNRTSPDLSVDDMSTADLVGDLAPIEDDALAAALAFSPNVNGTRQVTTPDSDVYRLVQMPDDLEDPTALVLELSQDWRIPTSAHVAHIDAELMDRNNLIGTAYYSDTDEPHAVKVGRVMTSTGQEKGIAAVYRTGKRWTLVQWGYTAHAAPTVLLDALAAIREADRAQVVEPFGLLGERVLVQLTDTGKTNARGYAVTEAESYRVADLNEDAVGMMRKLARLARTAKARTSGLDAEDAQPEDQPTKGETSPLPA